jgi:hypothetical protein
VIAWNVDNSVLPLYLTVCHRQQEHRTCASVEFGWRPGQKRADCRAQARECCVIRLNASKSDQLAGQRIDPAAYDKRSYLYTRITARFAAGFASGSGYGVNRWHQERAMAHSTRSRGERQSPSDVGPRPQDFPEIPKAEAEPINESGSGMQTPSLWQAAAWSECWNSTRGAGARSCGSPFAAPGRPALRLRRTPRQRTTLHCARPTQRAVERFTPCLYEFLTD